jgi:hypothetical protein
MRAHAQPRSDLRGRVAAFRYLLDRFDLDFLGVPLATHYFYSNPQL